MHILLISQWYLPEPQKLLGELAESLQGSGHKVTVLTGFPNWPTGRIYTGYGIRPWQRETIRGVSVVRVPLYPDHSKSALRRVANLLSFAAAATVLAPFLIARPDVIHVLQPVTAVLPAWFLGKLWGVPVTLEVQDMWPETLRATGLVRSRRILQMVNRYTTWAYRQCSAIRVISEGFRQNLLKKGVPPEKLVVIPNWVDTTFYRPLGNGRSPAAENEQQSFKVVFAGAIGAAQDLDTLIDAAQLLRDLPSLQFLIAGDGVDRSRLEAKAGELGLESVRFLGWKPEEEMPEFLGQADVLLLHLRDDPLFRITIPHKTYIYLAMGRAILAAVEGDAAEVIKAAGAGEACRPGDPIDLAAAVRKIASMHKTDRDALGVSGRAAALRDYSRAVLIGRVGAMLETAARQDGHSARTMAGCGPLE